MECLFMNRFSRLHLFCMYKTSPFQWSAFNGASHLQLHIRDVTVSERVEETRGYSLRGGCNRLTFVVEASGRKWNYLREREGESCMIGLLKGLRSPPSFAPPDHCGYIALLTWHCPLGPFRTGKKTGGRGKRAVLWSSNGIDMITDVKNTLPFIFFFRFPYFVQYWSNCIMSLWVSCLCGCVNRWFLLAA